MIHRLQLTNWRAYESALIPFERGTTFVVAPNGIGKSSLIEAARFALTGRVSALTSPVTLGEESAEVELTLDLEPGRVIKVNRRILADRLEGEPPTVSINGNGVSEDEFNAEVERAFKTSLDFIARNALLLDGLAELEVPNLRALLTRSLGLDDKRAEAAALEDHADIVKAEADRIGKEVRSEAKELKGLEAELIAAREHTIVADATLEAARVELDGATTARDNYLRWQADRARLEAWNDSVQEVVEAAQPLVPGATPTTIASLLEQTVDQAEAELAEARARIASLEARIELIASALEELNTSGGDCPVCLRPLDDHDRDNAAQGHRAALERCQRDRAEIDDRPISDRLDRARPLLRQAHALGPRPTPPAAEPAAAADAQPSYDAARLALEVAVAAKRDADQRVTDLAAAIESAQRSEELAAASEHAWRRWALTVAAAESLHAAIDTTLAENLEPIALAVGARWNDLFADRPDLRFDLDGQQWRPLGEHRLPFQAFSMGEKTAARIVMQLVLLNAMTAVDFCWLDEPLEHLDPRTRRLIAGMLAHGRKTLGLRQVVVTTYEEELASLLASADEETLVEYVRAGPASERTPTLGARAAE